MPIWADYDDDVLADVRVRLKDMQGEVLLADKDADETEHEKQVKLCLVQVLVAGAMIINPEHTRFYGGPPCEMATCEHCGKLTAPTFPGKPPRPCRDPWCKGAKPRGLAKR